MLAALLKHWLPTARKLVGMWGSDPCWTTSLYQLDHETHSCGIQSGRGWLRVFDHQRMQVVHHPVLVDCCQGWLSRLLERIPPNCSQRQSLAYVVMDPLLKWCKCLWICYSFPTFPSISHSPDIATSASFAISSCSWQCWRAPTKLFHTFSAFQSQDVSATPN